MLDLSDFMDVIYKHALRYHHLFLRQCEAFIRSITNLFEKE
jgi:hypothetical protein